MTRDVPLREDVTAELFWDPKVTGDVIAIFVDGGIITMRGMVESPWQKQAARKAAERVWGVVRVVNDLDVRPLDEQRREDRELRGDVLRAFTLNSIVPPTVAVRVEHGLVTLHGSARWQFERLEAETVAASVPGVIGVLGKIVLKGPRLAPADVRQAVQMAFRRSADLDADSIKIETTSGTVSLTGTVRSWLQHDAALAAAWAAPGVEQVHDSIVVRYDS